MEVEKIIVENERRRALFEVAYNPVSGYGDSVGERMPFVFSRGKTEIDWNIPVAMLEEPLVRLFIKKRSVEKIEKIVAHPFNRLIKLRCKYDHEFWGATCAKIQDKETKKIIPFVLNRPQRKLQSVIESQRAKSAPVRIILCKARQWGGSTNIQLDMFRTQLFCYERWHSVIATDVENQARIIRSMTTRVAKNHPAQIVPVAIKNFEGSAKNKHVMPVDTIISIGSMQQPDNLRSQDIMLAHLSEIGLWKSTEGKTPADLIQTIVGSVPNIAGTMIVEESTAKGVGNYFHTSWLEAVQGKSNYQPVFVAWYEIKMYQKAISGSLPEFIRSFTDYERFLWECGATLEGINWYREKLREFKGDTWRMNAEFPTTPDEAFQSDARRVFSPVYVKSAEQYVKAPLAVGELSAKARTGKDALVDIRFAEQHGGNLKIWIAPTNQQFNNSTTQQFNSSTTQQINNRFCGFLDIGGRTHEADYSVLTVIDRSPQLRGAPVELAARWRGHTDQDILAWLAAMTCKWYDNALLGIEVNSLHQKGESDHSYTILDEIADYYDNLFHRTSVEDIMNNLPKKYGFHTNKASKEMILDRLNAALRDGDYTERDMEAINEFNCFEEKPDGSKGAVEGAHDDIVISTAGAVWLATSYMEPVKLITPQKPYIRRVYNEATF